jgi:hypothetical protein
LDSTQGDEGLLMKWAWSIAFYAKRYALCEFCNLKDVS